MKRLIVPNWRSAWKWISIHLAVVGTAFTGAWMAMPDTMRQVLPDHYAKLGAMITFVSIIGARLFNQSGTPKDGQ